MFGLLALENQLNHKSTLDKLIFFAEFVWIDYNNPSMLVSFGTLLVLKFIRTFQGYFKYTPWIYQLPEVLIAVVPSSSNSCHFFWLTVFD